MKHQKPEDHGPQLIFGINMQSVTSNNSCRCLQKSEGRLMIHHLGAASFLSILHNVGVLQSVLWRAGPAPRKLRQKGLAESTYTC